MPLNNILVDSSYLYVLFDENNRKHEDVMLFAETELANFIVPDVVLTEVTYLFLRDGGTFSVSRFLDALVVASFQYEPIHLEDLVRVRDIMHQYADAKFDFVDCCIMALSERLNVTQVCTFDVRDFSIFRPQHCDTLELLP